MQPNKPDRPNRRNEQDRLGAFFSILLRCDRCELQEVLARQEGVFSNEPVAGFGQFRNYGFPRDQMVFRKTEFALAFVMIEVDDGDAASGFQRRLGVGEVFRAFIQVMIGIADEEKID